MRKHINFKIGIDFFSDFRLKMVVWFEDTTNFRIETNNLASWVPTNDEAKLLVKTLDAVNRFNEFRD